MKPMQERRLENHKYMRYLDTNESLMSFYFQNIGFAFDYTLMLSCMRLGLLKSNYDIAQKVKAVKSHNILTINTISFFITTIIF